MSANRRTPLLIGSVLVMGLALVVAWWLTSGLRPASAPIAAPTAAVTTIQIPTNPPVTPTPSTVSVSQATSGTTTTALITGTVPASSSAIQSATTEDDPAVAVAQVDSPLASVNSPLATPSPTRRPTRTPQPTATSTPTLTATPTASPPVRSGAEGLPIYGYRVVTTYPHDPTAFTQGLQYVDGEFYEGTGRYGQSTLRRVEVETGEVLQQIELADDLFGEGIVVVADRIYQLTWQARRGFVYDRTTFDRLETFTYATEGWGLTFDGESLIMSDGSATLTWRDPETLEVERQVTVLQGDAPVPLLNELEYVEGEIYANVWQRDWIVRIDPADGRVLGWIDLSNLLDGITLQNSVDVLNGIAYDAEGERLFVTGKWWPVVFEIELVER